MEDTDGAILESERKKKHPYGRTGITFIPFVKEGSTKMPTSNIKKQGILQQSNDWTLQADLDKEAAIPRHRPKVSQTRHCHPERCRSTYEMKKAHTKVHIPTNSVQRAWLANLFVPSRGVLSEFSSTIKMYHIELPRHVEGKQHTDAVKALGWVVECVPYSFT